MNRTARAVALLAAALLAAPPDAVAARHRAGLGIVVGEPTGISFKYHLRSGNAIDAAAAWSLSGDNDLHLRADWVLHRYDVIRVDKGKLPLFFGLGGRVELRENAEDRVGLRIPVGLDYYFETAPFDVFVEIVPVLDVAPDTEFELEGAIGGRYWF